MEEKKLTDDEIIKALENMRSTDTVGFFYDKENKHLDKLLGEKRLKELQK